MSIVSGIMLKFLQLQHLWICVIEGTKVVITHSTKIPEHKIYAYNKSGILKRKSKWRERKNFTVI